MVIKVPSVAEKGAFLRRARARSRAASLPRHASLASPHLTGPLVVPRPTSLGACPTNAGYGQDHVPSSPLSPPPICAVLPPQWRLCCDLPCVQTGWSQKCHSSSFGQPVRRTEGGPLRLTLWLPAVLRWLSPAPTRMSLLQVFMWRAQEEVGAAAAGWLPRHIQVVVVEEARGLQTKEAPVGDAFVALHLGRQKQHHHAHAAAHSGPRSVPTSYPHRCPPVQLRGAPAPAHCLAART